MIWTFILLSCLCSITRGLPSPLVLFLSCQKKLMYSAELWTRRYRGFFISRIESVFISVKNAITPKFSTISVSIILKTSSPKSFKNCSPHLINERDKYFKVRALHKHCLETCIQRDSHNIDKNQLYRGLFTRHYVSA